MNKFINHDVIRIIRYMILAVIVQNLDGSIGLRATERDDYSTKIKPLLRERCYACHGALKQRGGLRLDTVTAMLSGGDSGEALLRGNDDESLIVQRISEKEPERRMPPEHEGEPLSRSQIELIQAWIASGAPAPSDEQPEPDPREHWSFRPITRPSIPEVTIPDRVRNPIDAFLSQRYEQMGLVPQPEESRILLLRRMYIDLLGVPPDLEELSTFERDQTSDWYERTLTRLLNDPRHGERWARHWMDVWRYSDWWGLGDQLRNSQKHIWHWRDWIIESLNLDTPYDEMVRQMLAADELYPDDLSKLRATGFLARNYFLFNRSQWMEETVEHVGKGFLALTFNCAKCHDHKYDPIEHSDFYKLRAFFEPYHVRMDMVPDQVDLNRDGIPRAFDGLLEVPTYRFIRGQEKSPDKSKVIQPGAPDFLTFQEIKVRPIQLPVTAWQPDQRPWVRESYLEVASNKLKSAESKAHIAREKLRVAATQLSETPVNVVTIDEIDNDISQPIFHERFQSLDTSKWKLYGGKWTHLAERLEQQQDGPSRGVARWLQSPPQDFDATIRFKIVGGSQWRSVGLSFDLTSTDPTMPVTREDSEQLVYLSAHSGGPKIQCAILQNGDWQYPANGRQQRPIALNQEYTLRVQARGTLINVTLNGDRLLAWETPVARRTGAMQLVTFDALAVFHEVKIGPLGKDVFMAKAGQIPPAPEVALTPDQIAKEAAFQLQIADVEVAVAKAEFERIQACFLAMQATKDLAAAQNDLQRLELSQNERNAVKTAIMAEQLVRYENARLSLANAERSLLLAALDKKDTSNKAVQTAKTAVENAHMQLTAEVLPTDTFSRLPGAQWTPTRFLNSGKDDPEIPFSPQSTGRRSALADWITDQQNPLTARVAVNHIWMRHFGVPLVSTVFDFGRKGQAPSHPELLDWLASELIDSGWSMKHLHRLIMNSAAYRMSSSTLGATDNLAKDPDNQHFWHRVPVRLESQAVRDSLLSMAGTLELTMGGAPILAPQQSGSMRRGLYFFHSNNERNLFLTMFDEALVKDCYRREQSIVPQQALALTNSALVMNAAEMIAQRLTVPGDDSVSFVRKAFAVLLGIHPSDAEISASLKALELWLKLPGANEKLARSQLVWALINHNDFVTLR